MKKLAIICIVSALLPTYGFSAKWPEYSKFFLTGSDLVVSGKYVSSPTGGFVMSQLSQGDYGAKFEIDEVIKGESTLQGKTIAVSHRQIVKFDGDRHNPLVKENSKCVLFLMYPLHPEHKGPWMCDGWYGVTASSPALVDFLKRELTRITKVESGKGE